ncbi:MAG: glycosyltransferase family 2 protein [Bacilli bacterium]|nr:glycosyltransferase family 2 protein [Bacilli bacterium]
MIDIIIPVYNTPILDLERCLNSIINQTYNDYKVYIIDDGSNDNIKNYLDDFVKDKDNFIVKHINNNGVSNARNIGIDISNSKYITFIDADDTIENNFLLEAYELIEKNNLDIIIGGYNEIKNNNIVRTRLSLPGLHIYKGKTIDNFFEKLLTSKTNESNKEIGDCPTGRIYTRLFKRTSIGNLRFDTNTHMSEDTLFMIDYSYKAKKIGIVDRIWYNYYINDYSISRGTKKEEMIRSIEDFINEIEKRMVNETKDNIKNAYQIRIEKSNNYINKIKNTNN